VACSILLEFSFRLQILLAHPLATGQSSAFAFDFDRLGRQRLSFGTQFCRVFPEGAPRVPVFADNVPYQVPRHGGVLAPVFSIVWRSQRRHRPPKNFESSKFVPQGHGCRFLGLGCPVEPLNLVLEEKSSPEESCQPCSRVVERSAIAGPCLSILLTVPVGSPLDSARNALFVQLL
jgi:hypothetical protein